MIPSFLQTININLQKSFNLNILIILKFLNFKIIILFWNQIN